MILRLAKEKLTQDCVPQAISINDMLQKVEASNKKGVVFYLDRENSEKDLKKLTSFFKNKKFSVLTREIHYNMDDKGYIWEVHIL